jgi:hypothetical protein
VGVPSYVRDPPSCAPLCTKETRERIQGKRKKKEMMRNDEGGSMLLQKRKEGKTEGKKERSGREFVGEKERKIEFSHSHSIRDWGFVCGPILMKF